MASAIDTLDDVFGSSPDPEPDPSPATPNPAADPSDVPSLRRRHVTTGYREGISESKGNYIQEGFDAGFPLGAQLGMRAGTVLGILEGLVRGFESDSSTGVVKKPRPQRKDEDRNDDEDQRRREKRERILRVYRAAVKELAVEGVFAGLESGNGITDRGEVGDGELKEKKDPREELSKRAEAVISAWESRVSVARWEENMDTLEANDGETPAESGAGSESKGKTRAELR